MHILTLNGLDVVIDGARIKIFDHFSDVSDGEVDKIINYLQEEGFLDNLEKVKVLIVQGKTFKRKHEKKHSKKV